MKKWCAAIAIAASATFLLGGIADATILFFTPKPNKPGQFTLDQSKTPGNLLTDLTKRQSGGPTQTLSNYNIVLGDSFIFQEFIPVAAKPPVIPVIPTIPKPNPPTKVDPPMNTIPENNGPPVMDDDKKPDIPVVDDDKDPVDPPVVVADLPEPGILGLLGLALAGLAVAGYRRRTG